MTDSAVFNVQPTAIMSYVITLIILTAAGLHYVGAFTPSVFIAPQISKKTKPNQFHLNKRRRNLSYLLSSSSDDNGKSTKKVVALPPSSSPQQSEPELELESPVLVPTFEEEEDLLSSSTITPSPSTTSIFINQQTKRILIEELGYRRVEVERLRPEFASPIVSKRISRPENGIPPEWLMKEEETSSAMLAKLEREQKYPLKIPLLGVSLVLFGKGFSDALVTGIKVYIDFPGADKLAKETFMGLPVLGIDFACVAFGLALGFWTWKTMQDGK